MNNIALINVLFLTICSFVSAESMTLEKVWQQVHSDSKVEQAATAQFEASRYMESRAKNHWLPRLYLDAKGYRTNDPGASFFGVIQQRSLLAADFNADNINRPDADTYLRGALGLDLALYEGGMKSAQVEAMEHGRKAQEYNRDYVLLEQFSVVAKSYGALSSLLQQKNRLELLKDQVTRMLGSYQLGSKSNPVGYSGLLGMQALNNRLLGILNQYEAQASSYQKALVELGVQDPNWQPQLMSMEEYVKKYFKDIFSVNKEHSYKIQSLKENAKAGASMANMEKARFLPKIGAFAESYIFKGSRDTADGYMAGVYLQWNLFNASDYGALSEGRAKAISAEKYSQAFEQQERAEKVALLASIDAFHKNLKLLNSSYQLLDEQSKMTSTLFKNGSISALQVVEMLNRKADLIDQQLQTELGLIHSVTSYITKQNSNADRYISKSSSGGNL